MSLDPLELTRKLIEIPSPSGAEGEVGHFLLPVLEELGLAVTVQPVAADRFNLAARSGAEPEVVLCTHMDVVPPHVPLREDATHLYGRGACDTRGALAAMLGAAQRLLAEQAGGFGVLLVVGEETDSIGARTANERLEWPSRSIIVGEPTGSRFARGQKGALKAAVTTRGRAAHSAYPERGESALVKMLPVLSDLMAAPWGRDASLGEGTLNVGTLQSGVRPNVIPAEARAEIMVRVVDSVAATEERLRRAVGERATLEIEHVNEPQALLVPEGEEGIVVAFNTDIPFLGRLGRPFLFGPGSILDAHGEGEKIAKADILAAVDTYHGLVRRLLAGGG
ncbi:MAG: M20/M25/M40 family metallo-hydrolase [Acidobacteriota bacterium]